MKRTFWYPLELTLTGLNTSSLDLAAQHVWMETASEYIIDFHHEYSLDVSVISMATRLIVNRRDPEFPLKVGNATGAGSDWALGTILVYA